MDGMVTALDAEELRRRAKRIRLVLSDVDGVLTDGGVYYGPSGEALKRFSIRDGMGVERLRNAGVETGFVTGETSPSVAFRAEKLGVTSVHLGVRDKRGALPGILASAGVGPDEAAYIGDDVNDVPLLVALGEVGVTGAPADAMPEVRRIVHHVVPASGGHGAFRAFAEWILSLKSIEE
jgi:3-deoxy-D-manno-octulosonate 8-phosphate phosphatase (KDO 8-P phosphatase)